MKYLHYFEKIEKGPKVGDYIVLLDMYNPPLDPHVIAKITKIEDVEQTENWMDIKIGDIKRFYEAIEINNPNTSYSLDPTSYSLELDEIDFFSPNLEDAIIFITKSKYNL